MNVSQKLFLFIATFFLVSYELPLPYGWVKAGSEIDSYEMGIDRTGGFDGGSAATIKSIKPDIKGYGSLMQSCLPDKFLVSRIRMTGYIKTKDLADWAGMWLEVRENGIDQAVSFDNMFDRPIKGTTDWKKYEIVVDVPPKSSMISYGVLISGNGQVWLDKVNIEMVDASVETTGKGNGYNLPQREPTNLDFDK